MKETLKERILMKWVKDKKGNISSQIDIAISETLKEIEAFLRKHDNGEGWICINGYDLKELENLKNSDKK